MVLPRSAALLPLAALLCSSGSGGPGVAHAAVSEDGICRAVCSTVDAGNEECTFTAKVDLYASELGYYQFEECNGAINPTLGMEVGKTYRFVQADRSNYYHPLGFAYFPDGAHADVDELEPGIIPPGSSSVCGDDMSCPAPMYFEDGKYLGEYSNDASVAPVSSDAENFGLDDYEPKFFHPIPQWTEYGPFSITLKFDVDDFSDDIFYFCHIHQYMTGRIKLLKDDKPLQELNKPELGYQYDAPGEFDAQCGTFGLDSFQLPHEECPEKFVCDVPEDNAPLAAFSECIDAMDCHMMAGMTTKVSAGSEVALFIHQMIPHHQNAVNMAKALLKAKKLVCSSLDEDTPDCAMESILREIVNGQNAQIQAMRGYLDEKEYPQTDDCKVEIGGEEHDSHDSHDSHDNDEKEGEGDGEGAATKKDGGSSAAPLARATAAGNLGIAALLSAAVSALL
mmetsp:Transcript_7741/g.22749  ORF Transcript_7741/g.22749 Transcript_7741/m.22749 type:complete len:451 (-) Transcript_7741:277-1629(-)